MKTLNFILGLKQNGACEVIRKMFMESLSAALGNEYTVGLVSTTYSREEFNAAIAGGEYQVGFVLEKFENDAIGQGAIKAWRRMNPSVRIILLMDNSRICTSKTMGLYEIEYFDGLFLKDFNLSSMVKLLEVGRKKEEAFLYYQLDKYVDYKKEKKVNSNADKEVSVKTNSNSNKDVLVSAGATNPTEHNSDLKPRDTVSDKASDNSSVLLNGEESISTPSNGIGTLSLGNETAVNNDSVGNGDNPTDTDAVSYGKAPDKLDLSMNESEGDFIENHSELSLSTDNSSIENESSDTIADDSVEIGADIQEPSGVTEMVTPEKNTDSEHAEKSVDEKSLETEESAEEYFDEEFFGKDDDEGHRFTDATSSTVEDKKSVTKSIVVTNHSIPGKQRFENIFASVSSVDEYLKSRTEEIYGDKKKHIKMDDVDRFFLDSYNDFAKQYKVVFDDVASGKSPFSTLEDYLWDFIENLPTSASMKGQVLNKFYEYVLGYDVLSELLSDESITEIHVVSYDKIRVKQNGNRCDTTYSFFDKERYLNFCRLLLMRNSNNLAVDGVVKEYTDMSYSKDYLLHIMLTSEHISANKLPELRIKKSIVKKRTLTDLVTQKKASKADAAYLIHAIRGTKGILVCGGPVSGKTTLINALIDYIPQTKNGAVVQYKNELSSPIHPEISIQNSISYKGENAVVNFTVKDIIRTLHHTDTNYLIIGEIRDSELVEVYESAINGMTVVGSMTCLGPEDGLLKIAQKVSLEQHKSLQEVLTSLCEKIGTIVFMENLRIKTIYSIVGVDEQNRILLEDSKSLYSLEKKPKRK